MLENPLLNLWRARYSRYLLGIASALYCEAAAPISWQPSPTLHVEQLARVEIRPDGHARLSCVSRPSDTNRTKFDALAICVEVRGASVPRVCRKNNEIWWPFEISLKLLRAWNHRF